MEPGLMSIEGAALVQSYVSPKIFYWKGIEMGFIVFFFKLALYFDIITLLYKLLSWAQLHLNLKIKTLKKILN